MTEECEPASPPAVDPRVAAVFDDMKPYLATAAVIGLCGAPTELAVPIVRRLLGRTGVSTGPGLVELANAVLGLAVVRLYRQQPARWARLRDRPVPRGLLVLPLYLILSPAMAARWERAVVLRQRSPLWGAALSPVGVVQIGVLAVTISRARRAKRTGAE